MLVFIMVLEIEIPGFRMQFTYIKYVIKEVTMLSKISPLLQLVLRELMH